MESSLLNVKIRKQFFNKEIPVAYIGEFMNFTYPILHVGTTTKSLLNVIEGKHKLCKLLRNAKNPLIIYGTEVGFRKDSLCLQNLINFLSLKTFLNLKNYIGINLLHQNISQTSFCELGLTIPAQHISYNFKLNSNF
jgi:NADH-quinone oxidoreductase subunit G